MAKLFKKIFTLFMVFIFILSAFGCSATIKFEKRLKEDGGENFSYVLYLDSPFDSVYERIDEEEKLNQFKDLLFNIELKKYKVKENGEYVQEYLTTVNTSLGTIVFAVNDGNSITGARYFIDKEGYIYDFPERIIFGKKVESKYWYKSTSPIDIKTFTELLNKN